MPLPSTGPLGLSQIQSEFEGANPIGIDEYYRGGAYVPDAPINATIPTSGTVAFSNYRSTSKYALITYQLIGGGGAGGYGVEDGGGSGTGGAGTLSRIVATNTRTGSVNIPATGGNGGRNAAISYANYTDRPGKASFFGAGGAAANNGFPGGAAPVTSYGAGGGGAGGDSPNTYDSSGNAGEGGFAGQFVTGTITIAYGQSIVMTIGTGGLGVGGRPGGRGANGVCRLIYDGKTLDFTTNTTYIVI